MKSNNLILVFGLTFGLIAGSALAEPPDAAARGAQPDESVRIPNYDMLDPELARGSVAALTSNCPTSGIVAFSVTGTNHISQGGLTLLGYQTTYTNEGGGWTPGGATFLAPCSGLYVFTVSLVRSASTASATTFSDVYISIYLNGVSKGFAWAGAATDVTRTAGAYTVTLLLQQGDAVQTFVSSAGSAKRHLSKYDFTGYLVKPLWQ